MSCFQSSKIKTCFNKINIVKDIGASRLNCSSKSSIHFTITSFLMLFNSLSTINKKMLNTKNATTIKKI